MSLVKRNIIRKRIKKLLDRKRLILERIEAGRNSYGLHTVYSDDLLDKLTVNTKKLAELGIDIESEVTEMIHNHIVYQVLSE